LAQRLVFLNLALNAFAIGLSLSSQSFKLANDVINLGCRIF